MILLLYSFFHFLIEPCCNNYQTLYVSYTYILVTLSKLKLVIMELVLV